MIGLGLNRVTCTVIFAELEKREIREDAVFVWLELTREQLLVKHMCGDVEDGLHEGMHAVGCYQRRSSSGTQVLTSCSTSRARSVRQVDSIIGIISCTAKAWASLSEIMDGWCSCVR